MSKVVANSSNGANAATKTLFRRQVLALQDEMVRLIAKGEADDVMSACTLTHSFSPISDEYGCCTYARQMVIPKDCLVIGKIHRHAHHNFLMKGRLSVATEHEVKTMDAPAVFVSEPGIKRAVLAEKDSIIVTVHLTKHNSEAELETIEDELISPSYKEMGLEI
jgi:hypothetical protein|tara:strand:+ start:625 stop:1116 length:492 start_codon:yes stop_codon:yes gene_type:complete